jgi:hypothetical protein
MALTVRRGDLVGDQEGASMGDAHPAIGRASQHEVMMDVILSPTDMWFTHGLDMPTGRVAQAATRPWGSPEPSMVEARCCADCG